VSVAQDQYKYCFKVLWDYTKCKKTNDEAHLQHIKRAARPSSSPPSSDDRSKRRSPLESLRRSDEKATSTHTGVSQTLGRGFMTAITVQNAGAALTPARAGHGDIELSNNMSSVT